MSQRYKDLNLEIKQVSKYPFTEMMKKMYEKRQKYEQELEKTERCKMLDAQKEGVNVVKEHIIKRRKEFICHQMERMQIKLNKRKQLEHNVLMKHKIDLHNVDMRNKIANKLINFDKTEKAKLNTQKKRMMNIVSKLLSELEYKDKPELPVKVSPKKKKITFESTPEEQVEEPEISVEETEATIIEEWEDIEVPTKTSSKKSKKRSRSNKTRKTASKKSSKSSKAKSAIIDFVMPFVPNFNPRHKIKVSEELNMIDLIVPCHDFQNYLQNDFIDYDQVHEDDVDKLPYEIDKHFKCNPDRIFFEGFENGRYYRKQVKIQNTSCDIIYCNFRKIVSDNEFCNVCLEIEDVGTKKLIPGQSFNLIIHFRPKDMYYLNGQLIFVTKRYHSREYKQFGLPVVCALPQIDINVQPQQVIFKSVPIWKVKNKPYDNYTTITINNCMTKECKLVIKKSDDSFDLSEDKVFEKSFTKRKSTRVKKIGKSLLAESLDFIEPENPTEIVVDIINECLKYITHKFYFDTYFIKLPAKSSTNIKIYLRNAPHIGKLQTVYDLDFFNYHNEICEELYHTLILVEGEITGKFILADEEYLDFKKCVINSVYQQSINISNKSSTRVKIGFLFPSKLKQYFTLFPPSLFLKAYSKENLIIKFMPRLEMFKSTKYLDMFSGILKFPLKICVLFPQELGIPPTELTIYGIISQPDDLLVQFKDRHEQSIDEFGHPVLNLGKITTHETITADIEIENNSPVTHEFGFLNLPEAISLSPNYGFGMIESNKKEILRLMFSPSIYDMITPERKHTTEELEVTFKLTCSTAYKLGEIKEKPVVDPKLQKLASIYKTESSCVTSLSQNFEGKDEDLFEMHEYLLEQEELGYLYDEEAECESEMEENSEFVLKKNLTIVVKATIIDYWTELSHQYIQFPDTPIGSYSVMYVDFTARNNVSAVSECVCGFIRKDTIPDFDCHFEIFGGSDDIIIEPVCGDVKKNEKKRLFLIARPTVTRRSLQLQAKLYKQSTHLNVQSKSKFTDSTSKKHRVKSHKLFSKNTIKSTISTSIADADNITNTDYYLLEKEIWKSIKPYNIDTKYTVIVTFPNNINKKVETLFMNVECRVIRPQFITNLKAQVIDFGIVPVLTRPKYVISIKNISKHPISPTISPLSPVGPFIGAIQRGIKLDTEYILKVPITFSPVETKAYREYFEIKSGNTTENIMVIGEAVKLNYFILPEFTVCRISAKIGKSAECNFDFVNHCKAKINLKFKKICELTGQIIPVRKSQKSADGAVIKKSKDKKLKERSRSKSSKSSRSSKTKPGKVKKFSDELTPDEINALDQFEVIQGDSYFTVLNSVNNIIEVNPGTTKHIKIKFQTPGRTSGRKESKTAKKDKKRLKSTKAQDFKITIPKPDVKYVAKYHIMLENITLLKDFIIIAEYK